MNPKDETPFVQGVDPVTHIRLAPIFDAVRARIKEIKIYIPFGVPNEEDMRGVFRHVSRQHGCTPTDLERWWRMWAKEARRG